MNTLQQTMSIPCIRVDNQNDQEDGLIEDCEWSAYGSSATSRVQDVFAAQPFRLQTDLPVIDQFRVQQLPQSSLDRYHPSLEEPVQMCMQSAPVREAPFEGIPWIPEPATAIPHYHDRLSSPDETILSSTTGSNSSGWPTQAWSQRFDSVSYSPASHDPQMSRRGSAFGSLSAASEVQDPFSWSQDCTFRMHDQGYGDISSMSGVPFTSGVPSSHVSRHATPFNPQGMFATTEMDFDARSSCPPPQPPPPSQTPTGFRYPTPFDSHHIRASLTPAGTDFESDFDIPFKSDDCDSDYIPGRALRSPRPRAHRPVRSATHIRRPSYNHHQRSHSYNAATCTTTNRITKRPARRQNSNSHIPQYSPKISNRHSSHHYAHSSTSTIPPSAHQAPRPFTCPLTPYSCPKTFTSKNEWKRHVLTQHLLLGFWRCDLCPDAAARPNDFNRKDLFVQHLRRMHCGDRRGSASVFDEGSFIGETTEQALERVRRRCWIQLRKAPRKLACCFCNKSFESQDASNTDADQERERGCAVDWLEHVGRHLVALTGTSTTCPSNATPTKAEDSTEKIKGHRRKRSNGSNGSKSSMDVSTDTQNSDSHNKDFDPSSFTEPPWADDQLLLTWLIEEGLVEESNNKNNSRWTLVDRGVASEAAMTRRQSNENADVKMEQDAEGELE